MAFKGKPSINKRNRENALRERQKQKALDRENRSKKVQEAAPASEPGVSPEDAAHREFQEALRVRKEQDAADAERDLARRR